MILYTLDGLGISIATNPKSGVTYSNSLLQAMNVDYNRSNILYSKNPKDSKKLDKTDWTKTIFVFRDPYQRSVSMYLRLCNTLRSKEEHKKKETKDLLKKLELADTGITFNQFLEFIAETPDNERNVHYRKQDIPPQYANLVRTHKFKQDILFASKNTNFQSISEKLINIDFNAMNKNPASKKRTTHSEDLSNMTSINLIKSFKGNYPTAESFLNEENISKIREIFKEEIEFAEKNQALQQPYA